MPMYAVGHLLCFVGYQTGLITTGDTTEHC